MIAVRLEGRLGNQLFQYAFVYATAQKLKTKFYLDKSVDCFLLDEHFHVELDFCHFFDKYLFSIKGFKNLFDHHLRRKFYAVLKYVFDLKVITFSSLVAPSIQIGSIKDNSLYYGFFQSEEYFRGFQFKDFFKIKEIYVAEFDRLTDFLGLNANYIVVHIRKGDYIDHDLALDYGYFHRAIASIHREGNYYVFISDEPGIINDEFEYIKSKYVSTHTEIIDFQFLKNAKTCILSNSTFSWWGAYLNHKNPHIIAPRYWLGFREKTEIPAGIFPEKFTLIDPFD